jgi:hypothetical protein
MISTVTGKVLMGAVSVASSTKIAVMAMSPVPTGPPRRVRG